MNHLRQIRKEYEEFVNTPGNQINEKARVVKNLTYTEELYLIGKYQGGDLEDKEKFEELIPEGGEISIDKLPALIQNQLLDFFKNKYKNEKFNMFKTFHFYK